MNTVELLMLRAQTPQLFDTETAMPAVGVTNEDARHIAAYLFTLE